ncbi:MAG: glucosamine-6-phosphate deaminase [Planctomycetota bacterium]|jgi:glucosamine-6-phosphate deaminase
MTQTEPSPDLSVFRTAEEVALTVATEAAALVRQHSQDGRCTVLGLATGSTPIGVYREWIRLHRAGEMDFSRVLSFNLDEFCDLEPEHPESFRSAMNRELFDHVNIPREAIHFPASENSDQSASAVARAYEETIRAAGGIDWQLLGIGRNGHIGFNEPGSERQSRTREIELHPTTRKDAARAFGSEAAVPKAAITMGVATIFEAHRLRVMALGKSKAETILALFEPGPGEELPARYLLGHCDIRVLIDEQAAGALAHGDREEAN